MIGRVVQESRNGGRHAPDERDPGPGVHALSRLRRPSALPSDQDPEDFRHDDYICKREAMERAILAGHGVLRRQMYYNECMEIEFGWKSCTNSTDSQSVSPLSYRSLPLLLPSRTRSRPGCIRTRSGRFSAGLCPRTSSDRGPGPGQAGGPRGGRHLPGDPDRSAEGPPDPRRYLCPGRRRAQGRDRVRADPCRGLRLRDRDHRPVEVDPAVLHDRVQKLLSDRDAWTRVQELEARERKLLQDMSRLEEENARLARTAPGSAPDTLKAGFRDVAQVCRLRI